MVIFIVQLINFLKHVYYQITGNLNQWEASKINDVS